MKKLSVLLLNLFIISFIFPQSNTGQNSDVIKITRQNEVISFYDHYREEIRQILSNLKISIDVIGWSRNGIFACRTRYSGSALPGSGYQLIIFNTVNDIIIERKGVLTSYPGYDGPTEEEIAEIKNEWNGLLNAYGIIGQVVNPVGEINEGGYQIFSSDNIECWFDYEVHGNSFWDEEINWKLIAGISGKQKIVSSETLFYQVERIIGYYISPYENRIVILNLRYGREYFEYAFYGCHMDVGFN